MLKGETIPASEKIFSVFEEHTRWISKGKAARPVELGVPLAVMEDQHQFILDYRIMWEGSDVDLAIPLVESCKQRYPELTVCSFDRSFDSPSNRLRLEQMLEVAALPAQGQLSPIAKARKRETRFAAARQQSIRRWNRRSTTWKAMVWIGSERTDGKALPERWPWRFWQPTSIV